MPLIMSKSRAWPGDNNITTNPEPTNHGVAVTSGAANTKGSWAQLIASTAREAHGFTILVSNNFLSNTVRRSMFDIGIGAAASEQVIVANLTCTFGGALNAAPAPTAFFFPIRIPAGTRVAARQQSTAATQASRCSIWLHSGGDLPPWPIFAGAEAINADTSTTSLTTITANATGGVETAWTDLGSTTGRLYGAIQPLIATDSDTTMVSNAFHLEWGTGSTTFGERYFISNNVEFVGNLFPSMPDFVQIPAGTQMQARVECGGTDAEPLQYGLMGYF